MTYILRNNIKLLVFQIKFNIKISLNLTWKKSRKYCVKDDSYLIEYTKVEDFLKNIVSIDDSGFNNLFLHTKGLSEREVKENNHTLILAIKTSLLFITYAIQSLIFYKRKF